MKTLIDVDKPTRCIDPVIKYCQECEHGYKIFPEWVETYEDTLDCSFKSGCMYGFDKGRPEDEPTEEEIREFNEWYESQGLRGVQDYEV